jgi:hypothetical protein
VKLEEIYKTLLAIQNIVAKIIAVNLGEICVFLIPDLADMQDLPLLHRGSRTYFAFIHIV